MDNSAEQKKQKDFPLASLICGLLIWLPLFNIVLGPLAVIFGIISLIKIKNQPDCYEGQWMAIIGLIFGTVSTVSLIFYLYLNIFRPEMLITAK